MFQGLAHVWRVTAYYMGVDDSANLVKNDYKQTQELLLDIGHFIIVPAILNLNPASIIMGKNVARSTNLDYHVTLYIASEGYGVILDQLWNEFSWIQKLKYYWGKLLLGHLLYFEYFRKAWNKFAVFLTNYNIKVVKQRKYI